MNRQKKCNLFSGVIIKIYAIRRKQKRCRVKENGGKTSEMKTMEKHNGKDGVL